jgi:hypothetical protein
MINDRWIALLTEEEYEAAKDWSEEAFCFGNITDSKNFGITPKLLSEIAALKPKVDDVVALLTFLFLQGSESGQLDMFERFLTANLGKGKIVYFWSE